MAWCLSSPYLVWCCWWRQWRRSRPSSWVRNHWLGLRAAWRPGPGPTAAVLSWRPPSTCPAPSCWCSPLWWSGRPQSRWCSLAHWDWRTAGRASPELECSPRSRNKNECLTAIPPLALACLNSVQQFDYKTKLNCFLMQSYLPPVNHCSEAFNRKYQFF